jgi:alkylated DNA repair dioxygenase AlkB
MAAQRRPSKAEMLLRLPEGGLKFTRAVAEYLMAVHPELNLESTQRWLLRVFIDTDAKPKKLLQSKIDEGFSLKDNILRLNITEEGKLALREVKGPDNADFDFSVFLTTLIAVTGNTQCGKTYLVCMYILKAIMHHIGVDIGGVCAATVAVCTGNKDSAKMYRKVLGCTDCIINSADQFEKWASRAIARAEEFDPKNRPWQLCILDDQHFSLSKVDNIDEVIALFASRKIMIIRVAQRPTGPTKSPAYFPPSVRNNVKLHVVMSDFDNAFTALGGRKQLGGNQINNKKEMQQHLTENIDKDGHQTQPLIAVANQQGLMTIDTTQPLLPTQVIAAADTHSEEEEDEKSSPNKPAQPAQPAQSVVQKPAPPVMQNPMTVGLEAAFTAGLKEKAEAFTAMQTAKGDMKMTEQELRGLKELDTEAERVKLHKVFEEQKVRFEALKKAYKQTLDAVKARRQAMRAEHIADRDRASAVRREKKHKHHREQEEQQRAVQAEEVLDFTPEMNAMMEKEMKAIELKKKKKKLQKKKLETREHPVVQALKEKGAIMEKIGDDTHLMWLISNFVDLAGIDANTMVDIMQNYEEADQDTPLDPAIPRIVLGENDMLNQGRSMRPKCDEFPNGRGPKPMPRNKMFVQYISKKQQRLGYKTYYNYSYGKGLVVEYKHDARDVPELKKVFRKVNKLFESLGPNLVKLFNDAIVTMYEDGTMKIGRHYDKTGTLQKSDENGTALILVIKFGAPRTFQIGKRDMTKKGPASNSTKPFFDAAVQPMSAILMEVAEQEAYWHGVPEMEDAGPSQSIVLRVADVLSPKAAKEKVQQYYKNHADTEAERKRKSEEWEKEQRKRARTSSSA